MLDACWTPYDLARALNRSLLAEDEDAAHAFMSELLEGDKELELMAGFEVRDRRMEPRDKDKYGRSLARGRSHGMRSWSEIDGVCLHQTDSPVGEDHYRMLAVPAHSHVSQSGVITLLNPCSAYMWHAHALNRRTIGVEFEADTPKGVEATPWQLRAGVALLRYYAAKLQRMRGEPAFSPGLYAHRQSHKSRARDPDMRIARHMYRTQVSPGLYRDVSDKRFGDGRPWPESWK